MEYTPTQQDRENRITKCESWLASKGCTYWAGWTITDPPQRRKAAEWFTDQIIAFDKHLAPIPEGAIYFTQPPDNLGQHQCGNDAGAFDVVHTWESPR